MICVHRVTEEDPPTWFLHFESLTLARLISPGEGPACLLGTSRNPPCEPAFVGFTSTIPILLGWKENAEVDITMINYAEAEWTPPPILVFTPVGGAGFVIFQTGQPQFAFGFIEPNLLLGPIWLELPSPASREEQLRSAFSAVFEAAGAAHGKNGVEPWIACEDEIARPS